MRWLKSLTPYTPAKRPVLKAVSPRAGTCVIPLDQEDDQILFQYLINKIHSLYFEGAEVQLLNIIDKMRRKRGVVVKKIKTSPGRGREKLMLLHLKLADNQEIRRLIKIS